jgi:hypothetical protein
LITIKVRSFINSTRKKELKKNDLIVHTVDSKDPKRTSFKIKEEYKKKKVREKNGKFGFKSIEFPEEEKTEDKDIEKREKNVYEGEKNIIQQYEEENFHIEKTEDEKKIISETREMDLDFPTKNTLFELENSFNQEFHTKHVNLDSVEVEKIFNNGNNDIKEMNLKIMQQRDEYKIEDFLKCLHKFPLVWENCSCFCDPHITIFDFCIKKNIYSIEENNIYDYELNKILVGINNKNGIKSEKLMKIYFKNLRKVEGIDNTIRYYNNNFGEFHPTDYFFLNFTIMNNNQKLKEIFFFNFYKQEKLIKTLEMFIPGINIKNTKEYIMTHMRHFENFEDISIKEPTFLIFTNNVSEEVNNIECFSYIYEKIFSINYLNSHFILYHHDEKKNLYLFDTKNEHHKKKVNKTIGINYMTYFIKKKK